MKRRINFEVIQKWASKQATKQNKKPANLLAYETGISETLARGLISGKYQYLPHDHIRGSIARAIGKPENVVFPLVEEDIAS